MQALLAVFLHSLIIAVAAAMHAIPELVSGDLISAVRGPNDPTRVVLPTYVQRPFKFRYPSLQGGFRGLNPSANLVSDVKLLIPNDEPIISIGEQNILSATSNQSKLLVYAGTVPNNSIPISALDRILKHVNAEIEPYKEIVRIFEYVRDKQHFQNSTLSRFTQSCSAVCGNKSTREEFWRRLPWHYVSDGCYMRAEFMVRWAADLIDIKPRTIHKIWLFGGKEKDLCVPMQFPATPRSAWAKWWYHVAPIMRADDSQHYVLDPAIDPLKPLPVREWILAQTNGSKSIEEAENLSGFAITNRFLYVPVRHKCDMDRSIATNREAFVRRRPPPANSSEVESLIDAVEWFLNEESRSIQRQCNDANEILGDKPLWHKRLNHLSII